MHPEQTDYRPKPQPALESELVQKTETTYVKTFIEGDNSFSNIINHLLKRPLSVIHTMDEKGGVPWMPILLMTVFALTLFGFIVGSFQGATEQMWLAPLKIVGGVLFSSLICLPSLYIFCCIGGLDKKFSTILGIQSCTMAITSLLLIGFSPVIWLFSSSSDSMSFFGFLCISIWLICLFMGLKFLTKTGKAFGMSHTKHLYLWATIFTLVTLQMPTTLRPIIGTSDKILELDEKKFFIQHWGEQMADQHARNREKANYKQRERGIDN